MRHAAAVITLGLLAAAPASAQDAHAGHDAEVAPMASQSAPGNQALPPGEEGAKAALDHSPRHGEWVDVAMPSGAPVRSWIVYPERSDKAPVVVVIHEIFGESDWVRAVADQLAAEGFIADRAGSAARQGPERRRHRLARQPRRRREGDSRAGPRTR